MAPASYLDMRAVSIFFSTLGKKAINAHPTLLHPNDKNETLFTVEEDALVNSLWYNAGVQIQKHSAAPCCYKDNTLC